MNNHPDNGRGVLRNRNLMLLWSGQTVSVLGDSVYIIALPLLVLELTRSKPLTGAVMFAYYLPFILLGAFAGVLVDRFNRKTLMILADLARALILLTIPLLAFLGVLSVSALFITAFLIACFTTVFFPARDSIIPHLVAEKRLMQANSLVQTSQYMAMVLGALTASALIQFVGTVHAFTVNAGTFVVSLILVAAIVLPRRKGTARHIPLRPLDDLREILRYITREKRLGQLLLITAIDNLFIMGPAIIGALFFVKSHLGKPDQYYAYLEAVFAVGIITGMILLNRFARRAHKGMLVILGMILDGVTYIPFFWCHSFELLVVLMFVHSVCVSLIVVPRAALLQQHMPEKHLGRIFALVHVMVMGFTALSVGLTGIAAAHVAPPTIFLIAGLGGTACGLIALSFRSLRTTA
ncbi:MAG: MFS transporter [Planctomycetota bacterium]